MFFQEARYAITEIVLAKSHPVELQPRSSSVIEAQQAFIQRYNLPTERVGKNPNCRLRILPSGFALADSPTSGGKDTWGPMEKSASVPLGSSVKRLPLLEES